MGYLKKVNAKRKRRLEREQYGSPKFKQFVKDTPCLVCGWIVSDPAHIKTRGSGGKWRNNIVPLCRRHHGEQEGHTKEFEKKYNVDLKAAAEKIYRAGRHLVGAA